MGLKRYLWRKTKLGLTVDIIKNIKEEGGIGRGLKRTLKEDFCEDNPLTRIIYQEGQYDGKIEGYTVASEEYKSKLLQQADEFFNQTRIFKTRKFHMRNYWTRTRRRLKD